MSGIRRTVFESGAKCVVAQAPRTVSKNQLSGIILVHHKRIKHGWIYPLTIRQNRIF